MSNGQLNLFGGSYMTPKERVLTALNHEEPDRIPLDVWIAPETAEILAKILHLDLASDPFALAKALGHDLLYCDIGICDGFNSIYKEDRKIGPNLYRDSWGIKWKRVDHENGAYCEFVEHPLANDDAYAAYAWPDPMVAEKEALKSYEKVLASCGRQYAILGAVPCTILEAAWYLRGFDRFLMDLCNNRDFADELLERSMQYHLVVSRKLVEMGVDIIWWGDDVACETGPLVARRVPRANQAEIRVHGARGEEDQQGRQDRLPLRRQSRLGIGRLCRHRLRCPQPPATGHQRFRGY